MTAIAKKKTALITLSFVFSLLLTLTAFVITPAKASEENSKATTWNFTSSVQDWTGRNTYVWHANDGNGRMYVESYGNDPGVISPNLSLSASSNDLLRMYIWSYCSDRDCRVYFKRSGSSTVYDGGYVYLSQGSNGGIYEIDMSGNANWTGTITQIRIDPSDYCGSADDPGFMAFDWIATADVPDPSITLTSPNGGQVWDVGTTGTITWTSENVSGNVALQLYVNGSPDRVITGSTSNDGSYTWTVALPSNGLATNDCTIGISAMSGTVYDFSNSDFTIRPQSFTVTEPNGGEQLVIGETQRIEWVNPGGYSSISLQVSRNGGSSWSTIASGLPGNYYYRDWSVTGPEASNCRIRVYGYYDGGSRYDDSNSGFSIIDQTPWLQLTSPNGGETIYMGHTFPTIWNSDNLSTNLRIDLYTNGDNHVATHEAGTPDDGYQLCAMPFGLTEGCNYSIGISANNGAVADFSESYFCVAKPSITPQAPTVGSTFMQDDAISIDWSDDHVLGEVRLEVYIEGEPASEWLNHTTINDGQHTWVIPSGFPDSDNVTIGFSAMNHEVWEFSERFTIGNPPVPDYPEAIFFSQLNSAWADDQMGSCVDDMGLSGCAVTATTMLMCWESGSYIDPNPGQLNAWLGTNGGYDDGCILDWWVADNYDGQGVGLEYVESVTLSYDDWASLDAELNTTDRMPVVLVDYTTGTSGMNTHFVVVYDRIGPSGDPSSYLILDPMETEFSTSHTLARYTNSANGQTIFGLRKYRGTFPMVAPVLELTSPLGGESWVVGQTYDITWNGDGFNGTIRIQPHLNDVPQMNIAAAEPNNGTFSWTIPVDYEASDAWKICIVANDTELWGCSGEMTIENDYSSVGDDAVPSILMFHPAAPNPFNPQTSFRFSMPKDGRVQLNVYDLHGRMVANLADQVYGAGTHTINWNGRDNRTAVVPAGVYVVRLVTDDDVKTQSVVMVK